MKKMPVYAVAAAALLAFAAPAVVHAQEDADASAEAKGGELVLDETAQAAQKKTKSGGFGQVVFGTGIVGALLWLALFGSGIASVYFIVDSIILVRPQKIMPQVLIDKVIAAMAEGDVLKALKACESEPGPMANILSAGFNHVEEGYDIIQEAISTAADLETERLMQHLNWISVCANIAPMLGLLGTVQGMIMSFATLAQGAPDIGALALNISQALWTTAGGLIVAIPSVTTYYGIRNNANRIILRMQAMTIELIKDLRNVEVVEQ